jgi:hypothetical protein
MGGGDEHQGAQGLDGQTAGGVERQCSKSAKQARACAARRCMISTEVKHEGLGFAIYRCSNPNMSMA